MNGQPSSIARTLLTFIGCMVALLLLLLTVHFAHA